MVEYISNLLEAEEFANPETTNWNVISVPCEGTIITICSDNETFRKFITMKTEKNIVYSQYNWIIIKY